MNLSKEPLSLKEKQLSLPWSLRLVEHVKEMLGWTKEQVWGKLLYVFGYGKNWWKSDKKLLILIMCLQKQRKKKEEEEEKKTQK